jgi:hypothetical protein
MAEEAKSELGALRAEFKGLTGKAPSPRLDADGLKAKIAELKAAAAAPAGDDQSKAPEAAPAGAGDANASAPAGADAAQPPANPGSDDEAAEAAPAAPEGTVYLAHPEGIGCSFRGVELKPDKKGRVLAPASAAEELAGHGFQAL